MAENKLSVEDGFRFGFGFVVGVTGWVLILGVFTALIWLILYEFGYLI